MIYLDRVLRLFFDCRWLGGWGAPNLKLELKLKLKAKQVGPRESLKIKRWARAEGRGGEASKQAFQPNRRRRVKEGEKAMR